MIHPILDKRRQDTERTLSHVAQIVEATQGNDTVVATVDGKELTVSDLGQMLLGVTSIHDAHNSVVGYRRAMDDMLYAFGYVLHGLGLRQSKNGSVPVTEGPNRAQRRAAKRR